MPATYHHIHPYIKVVSFLLVFLPGIDDAMPTVDPGLFMILGVSTCREGSGYCLLGLDCTLDEDFLPDDSGGHCNGLKKAFTPSAHFTCCKINPDKIRISTTKRPRPTPMKTSPSSEMVTVSSLPEKIVVSTENTTIFRNVTDAFGEEKEEVSTTSTVVSDETLILGNSDIFVDMNNEVFKEVKPPILQEIDATVQEI